MSNVDDKEPHVSTSAFWVGLGTGSSRILGFLRDMVIAHYFTRTATDAFVVAFRLPNLFRRLFGEGALTVSFIPVLSDFLQKRDYEGAQKFSSAVFSLLFFTLLLLTLTGTIFAGSVVSLLTTGEGFLSIPGKLDLTIHQTRIMFCYILFISVYAFFAGILNSLRVFFLPSFAPALWNLTVIAGVLFFRDFFPAPFQSDVLAWATVIGGVLQAIILIPALRKRQFLPHLYFLEMRRWWKNPAVRRVLRAMGPSALGLSVMQLAVLINTYFASQLQEGSNSWIFWADRILELPLSLFAVSIGTAALPSLSILWSKGLRAEMSEASLQALRLSLVLAMPCAAGLWTLSTPIIHTLFEHGRFSSLDTVMTAQVVRIYGLGVIFAAGVRVLAPAFYAMKNTWLPAMSAAIALGFHIIFAVSLTQIYHYGVVGLACSSVASSGVNLLVLLLAYQKLIAPLHFETLLKPVIKFGVASLVLMLAGTSHPIFERFFGDDHLGRVLSLGMTIGICAGAYFVSCSLLRVSEVNDVVGGIWKRVRLKR